MGVYDYQRLTKQPGESEKFNFVFPTLAAGVSIGSVDTLEFTPVTTPTLDLGAPTYSGNTVQVQISGGLDETVYRGRIVVTDTAGNTIEGDVKLHVREK
jgi:hypothetical protein